MTTRLTPSTAWEDVLGTQILANEQRRAVILAWVLGGLALLASVYGLLHALGGQFLPAFGWMLPLMGLGCVFESITGSYLAYCLRRGFRPGRPHYYANALLELALPTATVWIAAEAIDPAFAINGPGSYFYFLFIILSALRLDVRLCLFTGAASALAHVLAGAAYWNELEAVSGVSAFVFRSTFLTRVLVFVMGGVVAGFVASRLRKSFAEGLKSVQDRERVITLFGQHVSPSVVDELLAAKRDNASQLRPVCVLVLDIRNFTGFAEKRTPEEAVALLNSLWGFMVRAVNDHHGFVNKFLGDGFLAVFGAPVSEGNDCRNALAAARQILRELDERVAAGGLPPTQVGLALHAGEAIAGNVGSEERKEYTVIGDVVNVAFRLEALNKEFGTRALISEPVRHLAGLGQVDAVAPIRIRGRDEPVLVYPLPGEVS